ncbi:MAG: hypothetical protein AUF64_00325 [Chloroflexi bacterium 13_1_20CM_54_36]|nr:MAG: hypothetical protein AUF64_00325 [Chloroflexi bacterium 13_1_20CM_54_36]OLE53464.1 MAG: hypothetical protein AUG51_12945 [Acidobacteria bacterium 13_1_20CM_3_53_8]
MANIIKATNNDIDTYIPFGGETVDLGEEAMAPIPEHLLLQYATGLKAHRPKLDVEGYQVYDEDGEAIVDKFTYAGFFTQVGQDKDLDAVMTARGVPRLFITHGSGDVVEHWEVRKPTVFLIAKGIPSNSNSGGEYGIAHVWNKVTITSMQVVIKQLLPEYTKPFVITFKSTQSPDLLKAIRKQYKVLAHVRQALQRAGRDMALPLWSYSLTLGPSKDLVKRGQGNSVSMIYTVLSGIPDEITSAYLKNHEIPLEYAEHFSGLTEHAVEWAKASTQRLISDIEPHEPWRNGNGNGDASAEDMPF